MRGVSPLARRKQLRREGRCVYRNKARRSLRRRRRRRRRPILRLAAAAAATQEMLKFWAQPPPPLFLERGADSTQEREGEGGTDGGTGAATRKGGGRSEHLRIFPPSLDFRPSVPPKQLGSPPSSGFGVESTTPGRTDEEGVIWRKEKETKLVSLSPPLPSPSCLSVVCTFPNIYHFAPRMDERTSIHCCGMARVCQYFHATFPGVLGRETGHISISPFFRRVERKKH